MAFQGKEGEVIEGFLCPICLDDLSSVVQLQVHFEEKHVSDDRAIIPSLKGLLNKAKKKLLNDDDIEHEKLQILSGSHESDRNTSQNWENQKSVPSKSHTIFFKRVRSSRIDSFVTETNKLLIRLDKLLTQIPSETVKRKAVEKEIVPWAENKDVPLCPFCAKSFNIARRRHHCRLCGAIMCDECSDFLSFSFAEKLVGSVCRGKPLRNAHLHTGEEKDTSGSLISLFGNFHGLRRSGSCSSLNSLLSAKDSPAKDFQAFRICSHCMSRLKARDKQMEQRTWKPLLSIYYEKLMDYREQILTLIPQYEKMALSLWEGETTYHLTDAEELRMKILKFSDSINLTAQKIRNLGGSGVLLTEQTTQTRADGSKLPPSPRQELLQKRIHSSVVVFLKENVLGLPTLPSKKDLDQRQERRRKETEARMSAEREAAKLAEERATAVLLRQRNALKESPKALPSPSKQSYAIRRKHHNEVNLDTGWGVDTTSAHIVTQTDDPIVQQMNILRNYIRQARDESKYEEVSLLEANLKELQIEFKKRERLLEA